MISRLWKCPVSSSNQDNHQEVNGPCLPVWRDCVLQVHNYIGIIESFSTGGTISFN